MLCNGVLEENWGVGPLVIGHDHPGHTLRYCRLTAGVKQTIGPTVWPEAWYFSQLSPDCIVSFFHPTWDETWKKHTSLKHATDATLCFFFFFLINQSTNVRGVTMCWSSLSKIAPFDVFFSITLLVYISCQFRVHTGCDHSQVWSTSLGSWPQTVKSQLDLQRQNSTLTAGGPVGACLHSSARASNASGWMLLVNIKICVQIALNTFYTFFLYLRM